MYTMSEHYIKKGNDLPTVNLIVEIKMIKLLVFK